MKKHNLYFLLTVLLAGLFASCSQEDMDGPQTNEPTSVTLSANVDGGIHTRADGKVTIPYFAFKLRYILEVWTTGANPELIYREEKTNSTGEGEDFTFTLVDNGDYKALLWADFVKGSGETTVTYSGGSYTHYEDQYYTTIPDLKTVTISRLALDGENTSFGTITPRTSLDAFYACHTISKKDGAYAEPVVLTRPFGQINISEKDADALANVYRVKFAYNVPAGFNVESGEPTQTTVQTKTIQELNAQLGTGDFTANLYYDYVFTPATGQTTLGEMTVTFPQRPESNIVIADYKIPANMPVVRNKRTNISGHIVSVSDKPSNDAKLSVTVSDDWEETTAGDYDVDALVWDGTTISKPAGYNAYTPGEVNITTAAELAWLVEQSYETFKDYTFKLTADIDLNNHEWKPIGSRVSFNGTFDGQGHTVSNLKCTNSPVGGLFAEIFNATVKDVTVSGTVSFNTDNGVCQLGGIVAYVMDNSTITGCTNQCTITATGNQKCYAGGIAGYVYNQNASSNITISNNTNTGNVSGNQESNSAAGGIIGTASAKNSSSITLSGNNYSGGTPSDVCIGNCVMVTSGTITIDGTEATSNKPFPVPQP